MKSRLKIALAFVISLLWIQHSLCGADEASDTSGLNKWKCICSSFQGNQNYSLANCSKSCNCRSDDEESASIWTCICDSDGFPQVAADGHSPNCFHACNCTWDFFLSSPTQDGATECGFYVMRHMLNIVTASITGSWMERFCTTEPFPREDLYDIQKRWARLFLDLYSSRIIE